MPKVKLTSNLKLSQYENGKTTFLWDTLTKGFGIKVNPSGKHKYIAMFRSLHTKRQKVVTLGLVSHTNIKDARAEAKRFIAERLVPEKARVVTLLELLEEYTSRRALKASTVVDMKAVISRFFEHSEPRGWNDITMFTNQSVERWYLSKENQKRKTSTDRAKRYAHTLFQYAIGKRWIKENPFSVIKDLKVTYGQKAKDIYLDENEVITFLDTIKSRLSIPTNRTSKTTLDMVRFYLLTGIRRNEIYKAQVRAERPDFIFIPDTKNGKDLWIPRNQYIDKYIYLLDSGQMLSGSIRKTLNSLSKSVEKDITIHVLRHTFISLCAHLEIDPPVIARCVNHSSRSITENVYTHRKFDSQVDNAFKAVGAYLEVAL